MCMCNNRFAVHLKVTQHCKSTILQYKIKIKLKKKRLQTEHSEFFRLARVNILLCFWLHSAAHRILAPGPGIQPVPLQRKHRLQTTGPPGNPPAFHFQNLQSFADCSEGVHDFIATFSVNVLISYFLKTRQGENRYCPASYFPLMLICFKFSFTSRPAIRSFQMLRIKCIVANPSPIPLLSERGNYFQDKSRIYQMALLSTT